MAFMFVQSDSGKKDYAFVSRGEAARRRFSKWTQPLVERLEKKARRIESNDATDASALDPARHWKAAKLYGWAAGLPTTPERREHLVRLQAMALELDAERKGADLSAAIRLRRSGDGFAAWDLAGGQIELAEQYERIATLEKNLGNPIAAERNEIKAARARQEAGNLNALPEVDFVRRTLRGGIVRDGMLQMP